MFLCFLILLIKRKRLGPVNLSKVLYRDSFWGKVFTAIGFWPPRGLKNHTLKPYSYLIPTGGIKVLELWFQQVQFQRLFRGCSEKTGGGSAPKPQSFKHWEQFFFFDRFNAPKDLPVDFLHLICKVLKFNEQETGFNH